MSASYDAKIAGAPALYSYRYAEDREASEMVVGPLVLEEQADRMLRELRCWRQGCLGSTSAV
jgi:hypothetical protein